MNTLVVIARFNYRHEAELAQGFLENAGIDSMLQVNDVGGAEIGMAFSNPARLFVRSDDVEHAVAVLTSAGVLPTAGE